MGDNMSAEVDVVSKVWGELGKLENILGAVIDNIDRVETSFISVLGQPVEINEKETLPKEQSSSSLMAKLSTIVAQAQIARDRLSNLITRSEL